MASSTRAVAVVDSMAEDTAATKISSKRPYENQLTKNYFLDGSECLMNKQQDCKEDREDADSSDDTHSKEDDLSGDGADKDPFLVLSKAVPRKWTIDEDRRIHDAVEKHGELRWQKIADAVGTRDHGEFCFKSKQPS